MSTRSATKRKKTINSDVLEGLTLNRTGEYVRVDSELVKRLATAESDCYQRTQDHRNPFEDYPSFLEIAKEESAISPEKLKIYSDSLANDLQSTKMAEMIGNIPIDWLALKRSKMTDNNWEYNITLPVNPRVADQQHSGRCWLFAALGQLRLDLIKKFHLDPRFEFSQAYLFFYDKIERSNIFFRNGLDFTRH